MRKNIIKNAEKKSGADSDQHDNDRIVDSLFSCRPAYMAQLPPCVPQIIDEAHIYEV